MISYSPRMPQESEKLNRRWFVSTGDTVFDVGANVGGKAELFLRHGARLVCVEPQPNCVAELKRRFKGYERVSIVPQGLAEKPGTLKLSVCSQAHTIPRIPRNGRPADLPIINGTKLSIRR